MPHRIHLTIIPDNIGFPFLCICRVAQNLHHNVWVNNFALQILICFGNMLSTNDNQFQLCRGPAERQATSEQMNKMSEKVSLLQARSFALTDCMTDNEWVII
jgi:phosphotransferase system IIB component